MISTKSLIGNGFNLTFDPSVIRAKEINPSRILFTASDIPYLKSVIIQNLTFPVEFSTHVDIVLEKMALYKTDSFFVDTCACEDKGTIILSQVLVSIHE